VDAPGAKMARSKEVLAEEDNDSCIECLWVSERARGIGLGQRIVAELNFFAIEYPVVPLFWRNMGYTVNPSVSGTRKVYFQFC